MTGDNPKSISASPEKDAVPRCDLLGVQVAATDYAGAVALVKAWTEDSGGTRLVAAANTHVVSLARHDPQYGEAIGKFDLVLPDGMPLVWCINRLAKTGLADRVYGPTFMLRCIGSLPDAGHFLLGSTDAVLDALKAKLAGRFPGLHLAGAYAPPFGEWCPEEEDRIFRMIRESGAAVVWVGLGCPKQELWLARNKERLPGAVYAGVGAAFAFHAGMVKQAPKWMQDNGLEWAFRIAMEPRRLWQRYFVHNSLFLGYLLRDHLLGRGSKAKSPGR